MSVIIAVLGVLALLALCCVIGVIEGRAQREAYRRLEGEEDDGSRQRGPPPAYPRGR